MFPWNTTKNGLKCQNTTSCTPQQNGVVERMNHTITKIAQCMLKNKSVPKKFLG